MPLLTGMKEIANHVHRSEATVLSWVKQLDFPARKIGGIWESDSDLVAAWYKKQLSPGNGAGGLDKPKKDRKAKIETRF